MASPTRSDLEKDLVLRRQDVEKLELELAAAKERRARQIVALYRHDSKPSSRAVAELAGVTNPTVLRLNGEAG